MGGKGLSISQEGGGGEGGWVDGWGNRRAGTGGTWQGHRQLQLFEKLNFWSGA